MQSQRDLAVALMNHGHALMMIGSDEAIAEAIKAYDSAISRLQTLPVATNPSWTNSLAAALMNRGQLLHRAHGTTYATEALASFDEACVLLRSLPANGNPWVRHNLAGILVNRANLLIDLKQFFPARNNAEEALTLSFPTAPANAVDAELALKAYRVKCDAIGQLIATPGTDPNALADEASDAVDAAVSLVLHWERAGHPQFRSLLIRFFRYGSLLYRQHQPHFLAEFLRETIDGFRTSSPSAVEHDELNQIARENLTAGISTLSSRESFHAANADDLRRLETWRELNSLLSSLSGPAASSQGVFA